jgi:hypothetical protein
MNAQISIGVIEFEEQVCFGKWHLFLMVSFIPLDPKTLGPCLLKRVREQPMTQPQIVEFYFSW